MKGCVQPGTNIPARLFKPLPYIQCLLHACTSTTSAHRLVDSNWWTVKAQLTKIQTHIINVWHLLGL